MDQEVFICSIEANANGYYSWLLEIDGKVYGGQALSQQDAINQASKIFNKL